MTLPFTKFSISYADLVKVQFCSFWNIFRESKKMNAKFRWHYISVWSFYNHSYLDIGDLRHCIKRSPNVNDRSPSHQNILNSSQVSKIFFSIGQGQLTPQYMVGSGRISNASETL